ncbi:MAG: hypothetical protein GY856_02105 [bacterium]|nr:hypothetical protein [bacterium]
MSIIKALGRVSRRLSVALFVVLFPALAAAQDVMTVGSSEAPLNPGELVVVPVYVRDTSGTALGIDAGAGRRIQNLSIIVEYSPAAAVTAIDIGRAGLTAALTPVFEADVDADGQRSWIATFDETGAPLPFNLDAALPGDQVAELTIQLSGQVGPKTVLVLSLVGATTALGDRGGTLAETEANGQLRLVGGTFGPAELFSDGFESGDTTNWSRAWP